MRNIGSQSVDNFKKQLDVFLSDIPDQPTTAGLGRSAESNSLLHQIGSLLPIFCYQLTYTLVDSYAEKPRT